MKLVLTVSPEEYDAAVRQTRHVSSITDLVIEQEGGLLATTQKVASFAEVGPFNKKPWGVSQDKPAILVWTIPAGEEDE